jgi:hypothetical protein
VAGPATPSRAEALVLLERHDRLAGELAVAAVGLGQPVAEVSQVLLQGRDRIAPSPSSSVPSAAGSGGTVVVVVSGTVVVVSGGAVVVVVGAVVVVVGAAVVVGRSVVVDRSACPAADGEPPEVTARLTPTIAASTTRTTPATRAIRREPVRRAAELRSGVTARRRVLRLGALVGHF